MQLLSILRNRFFLVFVGVLVTVNVQAQSAIAKELKADINRSAGR